MGGIPRRLIVAGFGAIAIATPARAYETDPCNTIVLRPIAVLHAEEEGVAPADIEPTVKKGKIIRRVTQYVIDRKTGLTGFCVHFGWCYRATATVNGRQVKAQRLLNCTIDFKHPYRDEDEITYELRPDPRKIPAHDMRIYRAFDGLLAFGVESESLAIAAVDAPRSRCGRIARRALAGDRRVQTALAKAQLHFGMSPDEAVDLVEHPSKYTEAYRDCV